MAVSLHSQSDSVRKNNKDEVDLIVNRYKEQISRLPRVKGWIHNDYIYQYQGFWFRPRHLLGAMAIQENFKARPTDVLLVSTPKSGTIWLKAIVFALMNRTHYHSSTHPLLTNNPHSCVPFIEFDLFNNNPSGEDVENMPCPRLLATHIPFSLLTNSVKTSGCRIIYICRNPKDVLVSMWKFLSHCRGKEDPPLLLEESFDMFSKGMTCYGPFWDHVEEYKKASVESPRSVFFLTYEDLQMDPSTHVKRMAGFLGHPFSLEEEDELGGGVEDIINLCSFKNLSSLEVNKSGGSLLGITNDWCYRVGKTGDWANHLTPTMAEYLDQITKEKLDGIFPPT